MTAPLELPSRLRPAALTVLALTGLLLWAYWPTLGEMAWRWGHDPQYSHGYLVPAFALYLLWARRGRLGADTLRPSAWGLALLAAGVALRLGGVYFHFLYLDQVALLPLLAGLAVLAGGRAALAWSWPAVAFLAFMVPLPHSVSLALSAPMQALATVCSTFLLQVLGLPALAEGNVILLNEIELGIVEACSGLRMLVVFFALSTAVALLIRKPLWEKVLIAASAVPIALASNILRITLTGVCFELLGNGFGGALFHDLAGWLMMPLGLAFLGAELFVLRNLLREPAANRPQASATLMQRVDVSAVAHYRTGNSTRRSRHSGAPATPAEAPAAAPAAAPAPSAPPEPASESVAQS